MKIQDIIIWILIIISIIIVLWYVFGSSPTFEQSVLIMILTALFVTITKISGVGARLNLLEIRFNALAKDFKEHIKHK